MNTRTENIEKAYDKVGIAIKELVEVLVDSDDKLENILKELVDDPACECGNAIGIFAEARYKNAVLDKARAEGYKLELDDWQDLISYSKGDC